ncbi:MAG: TonB-dependent receptor, partial [Myxococcota bacterium]
MDQHPHKRWPLWVTTFFVVTVLAPDGRAQDEPTSDHSTAEQTSEPAPVASDDSPDPTGLPEVSASPPGPSLEELTPDPFDLSDENADFDWPAMETVVTGTRTQRPLAETPVPTELILRSELEDFGQQGLDGVLRELPGVELEPSFNAIGLRLQGLDPSYVLILIDGERAIGRIGGAVDLRRFRLENIERLEIVRGPSSALYGSDAIGGVVNIITRDVNQPLQSEAQSQVSAFEEGSELGALTVSGTVASGNEKQGYRLTAGLHRNESFDLDPTNVATTSGFSELYDVGARARRRLNEKVELIGRASYERRDLEAVDSSVGGGGAVFDRFNITETASGSLTARVDFNEWAALQTRANVGYFRDQFVSDQRNAVQGDQDQETEEILGQLESFATIQLGENHTLTTGIDVLVQNLSGERIQEEQADPRQRYAVYAQDEWAIAESLRLVPGLRFDSDSQFGSQLSPKLTARYDVTDEVVVRASYGAGFRAPDFRQLYLLFENPGVGYVVTGNPDLGPERSQSVNLNTEWTPTSSLVVQLDGYANSLDNLIDFDAVGGGIGGEPLRFAYVNRESGYTTGATLRARMRVISNVSAEASYGYQRARFTTEAPNGDSVRRDLQGRAPHRVTFNLRYRSRALGLSGVLRGQWSDGRPFFTDERGVPVDADPGVNELPEPIFSDAFFTLNARIAKSFGALEVFAGVDNALDEGHPVFLPIAPRTVFAGVKG